MQMHDPAVGPGRIELDAAARRRTWAAKDLCSSTWPTSLSALGLAQFSFHPKSDSFFPFSAFLNELRTLYGCTWAVLR